MIDEPFVAPLNAALQVSHVTKRYGSGATEVTAVRDVSLTVGCRAEFESNQRESIEFNRLAYSS